MITPSGKRRSQVNQGGMKNQTIWDSSWFEGVAGDLTKEAIAATAPEASVVDPAEDLQGVMDGSNSMRLNPNTIPAEGEMKGQGQPGVPPDARFDPYSGEPLVGVDGTKLVMMLKKWLGSQQETADLDITAFNEKGGAYTITFGPKGKQVTKGV